MPSLNQLALLSRSAILGFLFPKPTEDDVEIPTICISGQVLDAWEPSSDSQSDTSSDTCMEDVAPSASFFQHPATSKRKRRDSFDDSEPESYSLTKRRR